MSAAPPETPPAAPAPTSEPSASRFGGLGGRALVVLGLSGLAVAQPLLELFGRNPEFFVAGSYSSAQIVAFALAIILVPPAVGIGLIATAMAVGRRVGNVAFALVVAVLSGVLALAVFRNVDLDRDAVVLALALALGVGATYAVLRTRGGRLMATYLSVANLAFLGLFLFASPTSALVSGDKASGDVGRVALPTPPGPVVMVVLDELPVSTLLRADGSLNDDRYPGFARLAETSTWFRNASSPFQNTHRSVPAILSGRLTEPDILPTYRYRPRNLMTLLGTTVPVERYEIVTDMCPPTTCTPPPQQPLSQALEDAAIVYGHRVLPEDMRTSLPRIDQSWGTYAGDDGGGGSDVANLDDPETIEWSGNNAINRAYSKWRNMDRSERSAPSQAAVLAERTAAITAEPALHFIHVAVPHGPWVLDRSGYKAPFVPEPLEDPKDLAYSFSIRQQYQIHARQVGAADRLIDGLLDHLERIGALEDSLLVVISDHGISLNGPDFGRKLTDANREEMLRMPLFIKAPGQTQGEIRDDPALTVDVLPSVVDLLDADTNWESDGHSLFDGSEAHTAPSVDPGLAPLLDLAAGHAADFAGDDWVGLAGVGDHGELVGQPVDAYEQGPASTYSVRLTRDTDLTDLPTDEGEMPFLLRGRVTAAARDAARPPDLLVAVNGRLAGVIGGYRKGSGGWDFDAYVADFYRPGANEVAVYEVDDTGPQTVLRPVAT